MHTVLSLLFSTSASCARFACLSTGCSQVGFLPQFACLPGLISPHISAPPCQHMPAILWAGLSENCRCMPRTKEPKDGRTVAESCKLQPSITHLDEISYCHAPTYTRSVQVPTRVSAQHPSQQSALAVSTFSCRPCFACVCFEKINYCGCTCVRYLDPIESYWHAECTPLR